MNTEEFRRSGHAVVDMIADYLDQLPHKPAWQPVPADRRSSLAGQELRAAGRPFDELLAFVSDEVLPYPFGNGHPRFFAWGNPPPALEGVLADFIAAAMNPGCAGGDHAAIYLEQCVTRWLAELVGFPGDGVLVSGGADGALTASAAARHRASLNDGWDDRTDGLAFRHAGGDETNHAIPALIQSAGDIYMRGTILGGREALRVCFMHCGTSTDDVDRIVPAVLDAASQLSPTFILNPPPGFLGD